MLIADMMQPDGKVFLKSDAVPISDDWPCISFTKKTVGDKLRAAFVPGRDILVSVGTSSAAMTENADHRSRLLSAIVLETSQMLSTGNIVPPEAWRASVARWRGRWPHSFAVTRVADTMGPPFPDARAIVPLAYASFGGLTNLGGFVEATGAEREAVMALPVREITLNLREEVRQFLAVRSAITTAPLDMAVRQAIMRIIDGIQGRVSLGGEVTMRLHPIRDAPDTGTLNELLSRRWTERQGRCAICDGLLKTDGSNPMLQPSPDRIDSAVASYRADNLQIVHLACNLAKNRYGVDHLREWLDAVRGEGDGDSQIDQPTDEARGIHGEH